MDEKIVLIGAGSAMFTQGVLSDLIRSGLAVELWLVDIDPLALDTAFKLAAKMVAARRAPIEIRATLDRRQALPGATAVITTIGVGGRRAWEQDVYIPRKYGLYYAVGDTTGPGGSSRALRMIPPMVAVARDLLELAPQALFFNYANPMAPICRAVRKATGTEVVGLCIGTHETWRYLAQVLEVSPQALSFAAAGINHLTWFYHLRVNGQDAMPRLLRAAAQRIQAAAENQRSGHWPPSHSPFESSMDFPFAWQCLAWFGAFPAPQDRHITEFFPQFFRDGKYYGKMLGVDEFSFEGTIAIGDQIYEEMRRDALALEGADGPLTEAAFNKQSGEQEQVVEIIQAVRQNSHLQIFANLPNSGQAPNLPSGAVLETPALVDANGLHAIVQPPLPPGAAGVLAGRFAWVEAIVEAGLEHDPRRRREKFIEALILDGAVDTPDGAASLADDLLATQSAYLS